MKCGRNALCALLLPAALLPLLSGCAVFSWLVAQFAPPQKVDAVYKPPEGKKVLVFVDDIRYRLDYEPIKRDLTEQLNRSLVEHKIASKTIPYRRVVDLMAATPGFYELRVSDIGRRLGAELVLYVESEKFTVKESEASPLWKGELQASVLIMDVGRGEPIWPKDRGRYPVGPVRLRAVQDPSPTYAAQVARKLADRMADRITKLFYDHTVDIKEDPGDQEDASWGF